MRYADIDGLPIALANVGGTIYAFGDAHAATRAGRSRPAC